MRTHAPMEDGESLRPAGIEVPPAMMQVFGIGSADEGEEPEAEEAGNEPEAEEAGEEASSNEVPGVPEISEVIEVSEVLVVKPQPSVVMAPPEDTNASFKSVHDILGSIPIFSPPGEVPLIQSLFEHLLLLLSLLLLLATSSQLV